MNWPLENSFVSLTKLNSRYPYPMARDYEAEISEISATLTSIEKVLNLPKLEAEAVELEAAA